MDNSTTGYVPLSEEKVQVLWRKHIKLIESFIIGNGHDPQLLYVNKEAIISIINRVEQRKQYFKFFHHLDMSDFKELALNCFWYIKLHPIIACNRRAEEPSEEELQFLKGVNEKFAVYFILTEFRALLKKEKLDDQALNKLSDSYIKELVYTFLYRDISKESLILLIETMAILFGLDPYKAG